MRASSCCSRAVCRRSEQRLEGANMGAALEQVGGEAVAQPMQRHPLLDRGRVRRLMEQPVQLARARRHAGLAAGKQKALFWRYSAIKTRGTHLPPLAQEIERLARQHDMPVLAALALREGKPPERGA